MQALALLLSLAAADPQVTQALTMIATQQGEARALAVTGYAGGCRGKNRFAFRNNAEALETLRPLFRDEEAKVRQAALSLTGCYATDTFEQEILGMLDDRDPDVRERAYEEAAHAGTAEIILGLAGKLEACSAKLADLDADATRWCVFALYGLGESTKTEKDPAVKNRAAQISAPFLRAASPKLREHALRNLELVGSAKDAPALSDAMAAPALTEAERKKAASLLAKLKRKK